MSTIPIGLEPVKFHLISRKAEAAKDNCGICLESLQKNSPPYVHEGEDGGKHPFHVECLQNIYLKSTSSDCPICRKKVDITSVIPWIWQAKAAILKAGDIAINVASTVTLLATFILSPTHEENIEGLRAEPYALPLLFAGTTVFFSFFAKMTVGIHFEERGKERIDSIIRPILGIAGFIGLGSIVAKTIALL